MHVRCHSCHDRCARLHGCICARICARVLVYTSVHSLSTARQPRRARTPRPAVATHPDTAPRSLAHAYSSDTSAGTCDFRQARQETECAPNLSPPPRAPKTPKKLNRDLAPSSVLLHPDMGDRWQVAAIPTDTAHARTRKPETGLVSPSQSQSQKHTRARARRATEKQGCEEP